LYFQHFIVAGGNPLQLWDVGSSNLVKEFNLHRSEVTSVKFHPNELVLATASMDRYCMSIRVFVCIVASFVCCRTIQFWDLETFEMISSTAGESHGVRYVSSCMHTYTVTMYTYSHTIQTNSLLASTENSV